MPFPLAHPAAVLPLRRYCLTHLSFAALVTGSVVPDIAYFADDYSQFDRVLVFLFGTSADKIPGVDSTWAWSEFSHSLVGSLAFCLPIGLAVQGAFYPLRAPLVSTFPAPHRTALLPLCRSRIKPLGTIVGSLLIGVWIHLFWDLFTHDNARGTKTWDFVRHLFGLSTQTQSAVQRVVWIASSVGGVVALATAYVFFLKRSKTSLWVFKASDAPRFLLWSAVFIIPALITAPVIKHSVYGEPGAGFNFFFHAFAELYLVLLSCCVLLLAIISKFRYNELNSSEASDV